MVEIPKSSVRFFLLKLFIEQKKDFEKNRTELLPGKSLSGGKKYFCILYDKEFRILEKI
jgi:hypothetical protein